MSTDNWHVDENIAVAETLPGWLYFDESVFQKELEFFRRTWQPVLSSAGFETDLERGGGFASDEILNEPIALVNNGNGLQAISNVCRHRASQILRGRGHATHLRCPYHSWTYNLEGHLIGQPEFEGVKNWNREMTCLPKFSVKSLGPLRFVQLSSNGISFEDWLGRIPSEIAENGYRFSEYQYLCRREYEIDCNWKVYVDNYLEGYHIPSVHPSLFKEIDYKRYEVETYQYYSTQRTPLKVDGELAKSAREAGAPASGPLYYWLFPNYMLNIYPEQMHISVVIPVTPTKTRVVFDWYLPVSYSGPINESKLTAFNDEVQKEDMHICKAVQKGLTSNFYQRGRYSVRRENGVHHFHRLYEQLLKASK